MVNVGEWHYSLGLPPFHQYYLGSPHCSPKDTSADTLSEWTAILAKGLLLLSLLCRVFAAKRRALAKKVAAKITRAFTPGNMLSPYGLHINKAKQVLHKQCSNNKYQRN